MQTLASLTIGAKQLVGDPLQCWVPAQFIGPWEEYSENYCYVKNTYFISVRDKVPDSLEERENRELGTIICLRIIYTSSLL